MVSGNGKITKACLRWVILAAVLSGLLFSCSEGIRLFPFPSPDDSAGSGRLSGTRLEYQKNLHRFEKGSRHQALDHFDAVEGTPPDGAEPPNFCAFSAIGNSAFSSPGFQSRLITRLSAGRAPPVSFFL